jgi:branched-chain amino acid aminotransferase
VDDRQIGAGRRGAVTEDIQDAFFDIIKGKNLKYGKWLVYV